MVTASTLAGARAGDEQAFRELAAAVEDGSIFPLFELPRARPA